ncbi:MAG: linear amide C-N hydrolase [Duncaniella sp.]|nr:linear amide C-N hydrolase [Duncaniella sp.]
MKKFLLLPLMLIATLLGAESAMSCSRILYVGNDSLRIVGRSLDWKTPIPTNIYVYPRGITKKSHNIPGAFEWTSRYGAIYAVGYDGGITEGMNEKGLVINGLFCKGTVYDNAETSSLPPMSLSVFIGWLLDLNATTPEVVKVLRQHNFNISGETFDGGTASTLHWGVTDAQGRCAIFEFDHGNINIYEGIDMRAMTNDPSYPQITAINNYWDKIGGAHMLPGTVSSPDRFVRGDFFDRHVAKTGDADLGVSIIRSILMNLSVPYTYLIEGEPNVSSTQWRSFANLRDLRYYFDIVTHPGLFYIDLNKCDLRPGAPIMKIDNEKSAGYIGDATDRLEKSKPFTPMY